MTYNALASFLLFVALSSTNTHKSTAFVLVATSALGQLAMAQVYSAQAYDRIPQAPPAGPSSRRHPFTNAVNHQQNMNQQKAPPKPQGKAKQLASPPLPRQNAKITPPSPPKVICDDSGRFQLNRVGFLGEVDLSSRQRLRTYLIISPGWLCSCLRSKRSPWFTPCMQGCH